MPFFSCRVGADSQPDWTGRPVVAVSGPAVGVRSGVDLEIEQSTVIGLRWRDVDLDASRISVRQALISVASQIIISTPKNHQARVVDLDPSTRDLLRRHRDAQLLERDEWGVDYDDTDLVFCREDGSCLHPSALSNWFGRLIAETELPRIRFHDLRHTHATIALKAGVPVKVIAERLGHASAGFTLEQYAHVIPGMQAEAARTVAALVNAQVRQEA